MNDERRPAKNAAATIALGNVSKGGNELAVVAWMRRAARSCQARTIRENAGISASEVARELHVRPSSVSRWERGERRPSGDVSVQWARILLELEAA